MLRPKCLPRFGYVWYLVQIERGPAGTRQKRMPVADLVRNMDRRSRLVFRRAWDHRVSSVRDNKKRTANRVIGVRTFVSMNLTTRL